MKGEIENKISDCHHGIMVLFKGSKLLNQKRDPVMALLKLLVAEVISEKNAETRFYITD